MEYWAALPDEIILKCLIDERAWFAMWFLSPYIRARHTADWSAIFVKRFLVVDARSRGYSSLLFGRLHSVDDQPASTLDGDQMWYYNSQIHRGGDLPAIIWRDGKKVWYQHGKVHRDNDLPAIVNQTVHHGIEESILEWWIDDKLFRAGPEPDMIKTDHTGKIRRHKDGFRLRLTNGQNIIVRLTIKKEDIFLRMDCGRCQRRQNIHVPLDFEYNDNDSITVYLAGLAKKTCPQCGHSFAAWHMKK